MYDELFGSCVQPAFGTLAIFNYYKNVDGLSSSNFAFCFLTFSVAYMRNGLAIFT